MPEDNARGSVSEPKAGAKVAPPLGWVLTGGDLDLGASASPSAKLTRNIEAERYDPVKETDTARKNIAYWLLGILSGVVAIALLTCLVLIYFDTSDKDRFDHLLAVINLIFGPLIALVGSATGFYFGSQSQTSRRNGGAV